MESNRRSCVSVAIFDNELHSLPDLGRYSKENTVVQPHRGTRTVIFSTEDGPATLDNQLYMYVGKKDRSANASVLGRNGLVGSGQPTCRPTKRSCHQTLSATASTWRSNAPAAMK